MQSLNAISLVAARALDTTNQFETLTANEHANKTLIGDRFTIATHLKAISSSAYNLYANCLKASTLIPLQSLPIKVPPIKHAKNNEITNPLRIIQTERNIIRHPARDKIKAIHKCRVPRQFPAAATTSSNG
jgi:hypothetical protein